MARIELLYQDGGGTPRVVPAKLEDKSSGGVGIIVKDEIDVGTKIVLQWVGGQFSGAVAYCRRRGSEHVLGIKKDPTPVLDRK